jgi:hypothetical protein
MRVDVTFISVMSSFRVSSLRLYVDTLYTLNTTGDRYILLATEQEPTFYSLSIHTLYFNSSSCITYAVMVCGRGRGRKVGGMDQAIFSSDRVADNASKMIEKLPRLFDLRKLRLSSSKVNRTYPALSYPALPCPTLSYHALSCPALPCATLPYPTVLCPALPYPILPCSALPCATLPYPILLCPALRYPILSCPALPYPTLPYPILLCPALPNPAWPYPALYNPVLAVRKLLAPTLNTLTRF